MINPPSKNNQLKKTTVKKLLLNPQVTTINWNPPIDYEKLFTVLQKEYGLARERNIKMQAMLSGKFKKHPLSQRGKGWMYHQCGRDCYRQHDTSWDEHPGTMVHHFVGERKETWW